MRARTRSSFGLSTGYGISGFAEPANDLPWARSWNIGMRLRNYQQQLAFAFVGQTHLPVDNFSAVLVFGCKRESISGELNVVDLALVLRSLGRGQVPRLIQIDVGAGHRARHLVVLNQQLQRAESFALKFCMPGACKTLRRSFALCGGRNGDNQQQQSCKMQGFEFHVSSLPVLAATLVAATARFSSVKFHDASFALISRYMAVCRGAGTPARCASRAIAPHRKSISVGWWWRMS